MNMKTVTVGWFEIPVLDMDRAIKFYESIFNVKLSRNQMGPLDMAWFPWDEEGKGAGGSLVKHEQHYTPGQQGILIYFSSEDVSIESGLVEKAGGKLLKPKTQISPEVGYHALFIDTEGNRIALHSRK
jgi:uncharacterized protein